jgi:integrase/recombinase XerD
MKTARGAKGPIVPTASLEDWTAFMRATGAANATIKIRTQTLTALSRSSGHQLIDLTRGDVLTFLARPELRPWSRVTYWRAIKAWDLFARRFNYIEKSIVKGIPAPKQPTSVARPIDDEAILLLLAAPVSARAHAYVRLALFAGLRVHEIAKLRAEDFDWSAGWLTVLGKGGVSKPVPIHPEVSKLAVSMPEVGYWFPSPVRPGEPVEPHAVSLTIKNAMASVGIRATAHRLRDTAATKMQRDGRDLRMTQAFLRHASVVTTQKYTAVSDTALQQAARSIRWNAA